MDDAVKVELTPVEQLLSTAKRTVEITDGLGRKIVLRRSGPLAQFKLVEALGDTASNGTYLSMCNPLLFISTIDGDAVSMRTKREIETLIDRLGDEGCEAVMNGVLENFGRRNAGEDEQALKN
jgi:hypothetical protein